MTLITPSLRRPLGRGSGRIRRSGTLSTLLAAMLVVLGVTAPPAGAHTSLESSDPTDGGTVDRPPASIQLVFAGQVSAADPVLTVTVAGSEPVAVPAVIDGDTVTADLSAVELPGDAGATYPASWQVGYRLVAADGDPFSGGIGFIVAGPPDTASAPPTAGPAPPLPTTAPATAGASAAAPAVTDAEQPTSFAAAAGTTGTTGTGSGVGVPAAAPGSGDQGGTAAAATAAAAEAGGGSGWWWAAVAALALVVGVAFAYRHQRRAGPPAG